MNLKNEPTDQKTKITSFILIALLGGQIFNIGCSTLTQKEDSTSAILMKENELIKKIKIERSEPMILNEIKKSVELQKAEKHLLSGLDEIQISNEAIIENILKPHAKEVTNGKNKRILD